MENDSKEKMRILYGGSWLGFIKISEKAKPYLLEKGYSEEQAEDIMEGICPRHLPILHEVYDKFGLWMEDEGKIPDGVDGKRLDEMVVDKQPYSIESDDDGIEWVVLAEDLTDPDDTWEEPENAGA